MAWNLTVNGTSLNDGTISRVASWDGVLASAPLRGENIELPGVAGAIHLPKVRGAYVFTVPLLLMGSSQADYQDRLDDLRTLLDSSGTALTVARTRPTGAGDVTESCSCDYVSGLESVMVNLSNGRVAVDLLNLSAGWS